MKLKLPFFQKLEKLEVYLLAADNPIGKKQLRPIFRRKRSREVLTREQVTAIKRGRRVLRREMKEQGLKRRIDFEVTATNLGLYFDRNRLLWPFFLWLIRDHTVAKILATTAVLTTVVTVTEPVIEYVIQYVTQYVTQFVDRIVTEYVDKIVEKDRFTINLSEELFNKGFELSETPGFEDPKEQLICIPAWGVPCVSIAEIPANIDETDGNHSDTYYAYTFYCRYINKEAPNVSGEELAEYATEYDWGLIIANEGLDTSTSEGQDTDETTATEDTGDIKVSDAVWVMVIQDDEVILCAKSRADGSVEMLPSQEVLETKRIAYIDRSIDYINSGLSRIHPQLTVDNVGKLDQLFDTEEQIAAYQAQIDAYYDREGIADLTQLMLQTENWREHYKIVAARENYNYYQVIPESFVSEDTVAQRQRTGVLPYVEASPNMHKYTVVIWLEGDDPDCTNELMGGHIGLNFQIKGTGEEFMDTITTSTDPTTEPTEEP